MKKYILVAGVNGAGKSTLYQSLQSLHDIPRVNTDEILREFGDWRNMTDVMTAGKMAVKKIAKYFNEDIAFNQETTLCGKSILSNIAKAKKRGYGFRRFAIYKNGNPVRVSHNVPKWYEKFVADME
ncbi:hypothetical protein D3Z45_18305 [Lachnospiraceae bacterium]|nr:hypothetical protein [Lachnospiraceae bacterium]